MAMNPISLIEKMINEHGSATVLKERLEFVREQYSMLQVNLTQSRELVATLTLNCDSLRAENATLKQVVEKLELQVEQLTKRHKEPNHSELHEKQIELLKHLGAIESSTPEIAAKALGISGHALQFHVDELVERKLVQTRFSQDLSTLNQVQWRLSREGRKLLFDKGVLS